MSKIFTPLKLGQMTLQHRIAMAPLTRLRADTEHVPLPFVKEYYEQRASVPGTFIVSEATIMSPEAGGYGSAPGIYNEAQIKAWKEITAAVHDKGSFIYCQLWALGRAADPKVIKEEGFDYVSSSAVALSDSSPIPRSLTEREILESIENFVQAAKNAMAAGFDGIEIHGANGYLVDQFIQDNCNKRTDGWGGSVEKQARFAIEVTKAIVKVIGADRTAIRLSPFAEFQGMKMKDPKPTFSYVVSALKELKLSYIHLIEHRHESEVENLQFLTDIWGKTSPVLFCGGLVGGSDGQPIHGDLPNPDKLLKKYPNTDVVSVFGRYFIANPDLPFRLEKGIELNDYDRSTFYKAMSRDGYTDQPFSKEFLAATKAKS